MARHPRLALRHSGTVPALNPSILNREWLVRPDRFCRDFLGLWPWRRQCEILDALARHNRVTVRSGHGVGKSVVASAAVLWFLLLHEPAVVLTTAPTARQVEQVLWGEIRRLVQASPFLRGVGRLNRMEWRLGPRRFALGLSTDESDRFQGFHCANILVVIDEASGVSADIYEAVLGVVTSENSKLLLLGNPTRPSGFFYDSHRPDSAFARIRVSSLESPNVARRREVVPGLVTRGWIDERREEWGETSPVYRVRVLGEFPESATNALVSLADLDTARARTAAPAGPPRLGCDVARYGDDASVIIVREGPRIVAAQVSRNEDLMTLTGRVGVTARERRVEDRHIFIDDTGVGGGVTDRLRELGRRVTAVNGAASAENADLFANLRAETWRRVAEAVRRGELSLAGAPERLIADLAAPTYSFTSRGQIRLEPKEDIKRRLGRSPDYGDALALTYAEPASSPTLWVA